MRKRPLFVVQCFAFKGICEHLNLTDSDRRIVLKDMML